ncbi:protein piccolo-like [Dendronephthya gigantea]|uniref:protein piccolo-like n=1 Tax=Dendronephthya gigantea TaxID=151771 RepID=UPI00106A4D2D|nr:protein piccolo-like [Dendronephthya gigantea]
MAELETRKVENWTNEARKAGLSDNGKTNDKPDVVLKLEDEENISSCQESSPKSRRKISKPKHYKPTTNGEDNGVHNGISQTPQDLNGSAGSPESVVPDERGKSLPQDAVHVMAAIQGEKHPAPSPSKRTTNTQKPKRAPAVKSSNKKAKHDTPTVPRKPEDLIKEAMMQGQKAPQASKRDAQYRKSYAYKIWKERGSQEVKGVSEENNPIAGVKNKLPPGPLQNQARAAFYWPGNQYKSTTPPGFFANGKYYAINPQMVPAVHGISQLPPTVPPVSVPTSALAIQNSRSLIQSSTPSVVSPGGLNPRYAGMTTSSAGEAPKSKVVPPNVTVVSQYPKEMSRIPKPAIKSPGVKTPPPISKALSGTKCVSPVPVPQIDTAISSPNENGFTAKTPETTETKENTFSTTPSNLVSLMKTSLRQKHSKENVQPLPNMFKSKRKLETDKNDGPATKKSGKPTIFTPLNEQEAEKLANDIYDVNLEYFPFQTLAEKAAQSEEALPETPERPKKSNKVKEIEKVRCLLKDFYDVTFSCTEDPDMQKFDSASRKFGRKNILNHLSLLDRYFAELQKKLDA